MGRTYSELKKIAGKAGYTKEWKEEKNKKKEYKDLNPSDFNLDAVKKDFEKRIGLDTFSSDLSSLNQKVSDIYNGWQTPETMKNTKSFVEGMYNRIGSFQEYQQVFGEKGNDTGVGELHSFYGDAIKNWDEQAQRYGKYKNADAYNKETSKLKELYSMSASDIKPYLDSKDSAVAYTTSDGYNIKWKDLYNDAAKNEFEKTANEKYDVGALGEYAKQDVEYKTPALSNTAVVRNEDYEKFKYNIVNGDSEALAVMRSNNFSNKLYIDLEKLEHLTDEEKRLYNSICKQDGYGAGDEYLNLLAPILEKRAVADEGEYWAKAAKEAPFTTSIYSVGQNVHNAFVGSLAMLGDTMDGEINPNSPYYSGNRAVKTIRSTVENDVIDSDVGKFFYRHGMSAADNVAMMAVSGFGQYGAISKGLQSGLMASNSFTDTTLDAKERGLSDEQALTIGAIAGAAEMIFESKGFEALFGEESLSKGVRGYVLNNLITEVIGEESTELTNDVADFLVAQDMSQWKLSMAGYVASGMTEKEALSKTIKDYASKYVDIAAGTLFSSGVISGPSAINLHYENKGMGKDIRESGLSNDVFNMANNPEFADVYNAYTAYVKKGINADNIKDAQLGGLYRSIDYAAQEGFQTANRDINKAKKTIDKQKDIREHSPYDSQVNRATARLDKAIANQTDAQVRRLNNAETLEKLGTIDKSVSAYKINKAFEESEAKRKEDIKNEVADISSGVEKTQIASTNKEIDIKGVKFDGDDVSVVTNEGDVSLDDVLLSDIDAELLVHAKSMDAEEANMFVEQYDRTSGVSVEEYANDFNRVYDYSKNKGFTEDYILKNMGSLSTNQVKAIYTNTRIKADHERQAVIKEATANLSGKMAYRGTFDDSIIDRTNSGAEGKVNWKSLSYETRSLVSFAELCSKALGYNVVLERDKSYNGYITKGNTIHIDIAARNYDNGVWKSAFVPTLSHEITHSFERTAPELYRRLEELVFSTLEAHDGIDELSRVATEIARLDKAHPEKKHNEKDARSEIIARACEDMLSMSKEGRKMFDSLTESEQKTFIEKVKEIIQNIKEWVDELLGHYSSTSYEAKALRQYDEQLNEILKLWDEMLAESKKVNEAGVFKELADVGIQYNADSKSIAPDNQFSERTWTSSEYVQNREVAVSAIMKAIGVSKADAERYINNINSIAKMIADDRERLDYDENVDETASALKSNKEYKWTVDMSTLCAKRLLFTGTFDAIQRQLPNRAFTSEEMIGLRSMMEKKGYEVACGICYVESTRRELGPITQEFIERYKLSQKTGKPISRINSKGQEKVIEEAETRRQFVADKNYTPTLAELNTTDIDLVKKEHPDVFAAYFSFMKSRGQATPKLLETRTEYKGEILKHFNKSAVESRNKAGGLRVQSFSDFEVAHLIDMMQIVLDMSRVGLKSQAYTKVPAFADVFGGTGMKINLSLIAKNSGLDENGNLIFDDVEGMNHKEAFRLREKYSKNVGTILVGKNNAHIIAAMADPRIDFVIPFHKSFWKESLYEALGLTGYEDYTETQNEKPIDPSRKIKNFQPSEYWDYSKSGKENEEIYLAMCKADGRIPKFPQFKGYDGYWKLLIDFKMYDNEGVGSPQMEVMPEFDMDSANNILNEYKGGHRTFPVAKDIVDEFLKNHEADMPVEDVQFCERSNEPSEFNPDGLTLRGQLEEAFDTAIPNEKRYVYVGRFSQSFIDILKKYIDIKKFPIVMNYRDAYLSMESKENGKYQGAGINYHNLGVDGLESALKSFDEPEYVLLSTKEKKIELILKGRDYKNRQLFSIVEVNTTAHNKEGFLDAHVVTSVYGKRNLDKHLASAEQDGRLVYDKNKNEEISQGITQVQYEGNINDISSSDNILNNSNGEINNEIVNNEDKQFADRDFVAYDSTALLKESTIDTYLKDYASKTTPNYAQAYITYMSPRQFLELTTSDKINLYHIEKESKTFDREQFEDATHFQPIQLWIDHESGQVESHEGRHRMVALSNEGIYDVPVLLFDSSNKNNKENLTNFTLIGQFNEYRNEVIEEAIPLNYANRDAIIEKFGTKNSRQKMGEKYGWKQTLQYADRDSNGNTLTSEQIEFFKNSKVRDENGNLLVVYHGSPNGGFTEFRMGDGTHSSLMAAYGAGYYFDTVKASAERYTKPVNKTYMATNPKVYEVYLNIKNPIRIIDGNRTISKEQLAQIISRGNYEWFFTNGMPFELRKKLGKTKEEIQKLPRKEIISSWSEMIVERAYSDADILSAMVKAYKGGSILSAMKDVLGYDGAVYKDQYGEIWVAWDSNQIKSEDNTNPTSSDDIQYADRTTNTSTYDLMGENERLRKENEAFKADVERLKERLSIEKKVTHGNYFNENQLNAVAGHLRKISNSEYSKEHLAVLLKDVYSYIAHGEQVTWDEVFERCYSVASAMLSQAKPFVSTNYNYKNLLAEIKKTRVVANEQQKAEARYVFDKRWNQVLFGKVTLVKEGTSLDRQWQEWAERYPEIFDAETNSTDMLVELYNICNDLREASEAIEEYDEAEMTRWLATEIYNQYWNVSPIRTTADKYDKQIKRLNFEHRQMISQLRNDYKDRLDKQHKYDKAKYNKLIKDIRERKNRDIAEAKQHGRERLSMYKENAEKKTKIQSITSNALSLNDMLLKNSKDKHIPEAMKGVVTELLQAIDFSSKRMLEGGEATKKDESLAKALGHLKDAITDGSQEVGDILDEMYGSGIDDLTKELVKSVDKAMSEMREGDAYTLNEMSLDDLKKLDDIVKIIKRTVNRVNKFHVAQYNAGVQALGIKSTGEIDSRMKIFKDNKKHFEKLKTSLYWNNLNPYYAFKNLGEAARKIFTAIQDGQDKLAFLSREVIDFAESVYSAKEYDKWKDTFFDFEIAQPNGKTAKFSMNVSQIMSLYCVTKQEDARRHILYGEENGEGGGITIVETEKTDAVRRNIRLTEANLKTILDTLNDKDKVGRAKEVADKLQEFMGTRGAELGNEISMARWGIKSFGIENYFPIKVSDGSVPKKNDAPGVNSTSMLELLNMSFTHARNHFAQQSVEIGDMLDVFSNHMSNMVRYNAMALPILDMYKWMNCRGKDEYGVEFSIQTSVRDTFGDHAWSYFNTFLKDISGGTKKSTRDKLAVRFFKNAKIAKVAGNIRVAALQFTSYIRAGAVIDNKYLLKAIAHKPKSAKAEEKCGIALWKSMGYYDTDITRGLSEQIKHSTNVRDKIIDKSLWLAEKADKITWGYLWNACELEIRDTRKDLEVGSEEFYNAIALRLRDVIYRTQVVDSMLTRSQMMRSPDGWDKVLTTFASENTLSLNLALDVFTSYELDKRSMGKKAAKEKNKKFIRKAVTAYIVTNVVTSALQSLFDAFRDTEEDEKDMAYWRKLLLENFLSNSSIINKIPYLNTFGSIISGFTPSRTDTDWMSDSVKAVRAIYKCFTEGGNTEKAIRYSLKALSDSTGIAGYNLYRDIYALYELFAED